VRRVCLLPTAARVMLMGALTLCCTAQQQPRRPGELVWAIGSDPKTFDPAKVDDQPSETVRHLTAGVLLRFNRSTQKMDPELAQTWSTSQDGRVLTIRLRPGLQFSDGGRLTSQDALLSIRRVLSHPDLYPAAQEFGDPVEVKLYAPDQTTVRIQLPRRVIAIDRVLEEIAIEPAGTDSEARVTAGPFVVSEYERAQCIRLTKNPRYFKTDTSGHRLPYAAGIRLDIVSNPEQEIRSFLRGDYDLIENLGADYFDLLKQKAPVSVRDVGASLNTEQLWFNESSRAPLPEWEKLWFRNQSFRKAVSLAVHRDDLARIAYQGHATPAYSYISPANTIWHNEKIVVPNSELANAKALLLHAGFTYAKNSLRDSSGHPVKFSILTNVGNSQRMKMATLIQHDLAELGMQVSVVSLDFPALIDRLMQTQDYEACLLGIENVDPEPNAMMNVWLSSSPNHQWNPSEKSPETPWEAEIDHQMRVQASATQWAERKRAVDRVQEIVAEQQPFIYLVYPNALYAISPRLQGVTPSRLQPGLTWDPEWLRIQGSRQ
jgi:peptide/nickel transport system substrate-binding protein